MEEDKSSTEIEKQLQSLLSRSTEHEQKARRRAFYWTVIPAALALILLMGTGLQMRSSNQAVSVAKVELGEVEDELLSVKLDLDNTNGALETANQDVIVAHEALTETLVTLEVVTGNLVQAQSRLAQSEIEMKVLQGEVDGLQEKVNGYNQEILELNRQIEDLLKSLESVQEELRAAIDLKRYRFVGDWMLTLKYVATRFPEAGGLLQTIIEYQEVPWTAGGFSTKEGFDSPSFAAYVLQLNERLSLTNPADRYNLINLVPIRRGTPQVGDIVFYDGGYTMFYFLDEQGVPFVIGMTTQGVLALTPDFAPVKGYGVTER